MRKNRNWVWRTQKTQKTNLIYIQRHLLFYVVCKDFICRARFRSLLYSWLLDHSSISRARRTGNGCDSCRVWAFLKKENLLFKNISEVGCRISRESLTLYTNPLGSMMPCRKNELALERHPRWVDRTKKDSHRLVSSEQRWQSLVETWYIISYH